jgi:hypothetical protein
MPEGESPEGTMSGRGVKAPAESKDSTSGEVGTREGEDPATWRGSRKGAQMPEKRKPEGTMSGREVKAPTESNNSTAPIML